MSKPPHIFRPKARLLLLLGDQLIRDAGLAVFELVKNAYDADATKCTIVIQDPESPRRARVTVQDNGSGMDLGTVEGVWLEPGTDYRSRQRDTDTRSGTYHRLPLGEKGVGRFAVHKLGNHITLVSRKAGEDEVVVRIDWNAFARNRYLSDVPVDVTTRTPEVFTGTKTGTRIEVSELHEPWTKTRTRALHRAVTSICSPFSAPQDFRATLAVRPASDWLEGLLDVDSVLALSLFRASGVISGDSLVYDYSFVPLPAMKGQITERERLGLRTTLMRKVGRKRERLDLGSWHIGDVRFDLRIYDREPQVLELSTSDKAGLKQFLNQNGGVRVYRDGIRVFDFGEPGNDWLDLGGRRVNVPTVHISNNQILGALSLDGRESRDLIEKTNREGFIENAAYEALRQAAIFALTQVEAERKLDKERVRQQYSRSKPKQPVLDDIAELRAELDKRKLAGDLGKYLDRIESQFLQVREQLLTAAGPGLTLTTVIHEVEKIIKELVLAAKRGEASAKVKALTQHLAHMIDGLAFMVRKSGSSREKASVLITQALFNTEYRLKVHGIKVTNGMDHGNRDFAVRCTRRLIVTLLMNLIDNSIYWLDQKGDTDRQMYIGATLDLDDRPTIVVADNGPGFIDPPDYLIQPFFTRKPDGMGLGLHLASEVAKLHKGELIFPNRQDAGIPKQFTGAVVALQFPAES